VILRIENNFFIDDEGSPLPARGRDLELENAPGRPFPVEAVEHRVRELREQGIGAVRLGIRWDYLVGSMPSGIKMPEGYNEAYLAWLRKILRALDEAGPSGGAVAGFLVPVVGEGAFPEPMAPAPVDRYIAAYRHAYRRLKNCRAIAAWGLIGGAGPWPAWIPDAAAFAAAFRERMREVNPDLLFFSERAPADDAEGFAARLGLVPPALMTALFGERAP
jgi:hypothetical protein